MLQGFVTQVAADLRVELARRGIYVS